MKQILSMLIWSITFFAHSSNSDEISEYRKDISENIFACMEWSKQSYIEVLQMPVKKLHDYMRWKMKLEEEKEKSMEKNKGEPK